MEGQLDKCRGTGGKENCEHPQIQNPPQLSLIFQLHLPAARELPIPVFRRPCFLRLRAVGKTFKAKPGELAQEGACNKLYCLVLKIPGGTL